MVKFTRIKIKVEKSKKNKKVFLLIIFLLFFSITLFIISLNIDNNEQILEKKELNTTLSIGDTAGFDVNNYSLGFGAITKNVRSYRNDTVITNNYDFPIVVELNVIGNISDFLVFDREIYFEPGESKNIYISTIRSTGEEPYGNYSGNFNIIFKRAG